MMKKLLLSVAFVATTTVINLFGQACVPDVSCLPAGATSGVCPDTLVGLPIACVGVPYTAVVSIKIPSTATDPTTGLVANIDDIEIKNVSGLAPGLNYTCEPTNCKFLKNTNGCILISGTPTAVHNQNVVVSADAHIKIFGAAITRPQTFSGYKSIVNNCTGIGENLDLSKFDVEQNAPNPFNEKSTISFNSPESDVIEFNVYNVMGALVYSNKFDAQQGVNTITIEANSFNPGVYFYAVSNGETTITKRMIVSGK